MFGAQWQAAATYLFKTSTNIAAAVTTDICCCWCCHWSCSPGCCCCCAGQLMGCSSVAGYTATRNETKQCGKDLQSYGQGGFRSEAMQTYVHASHCSNWLWQVAVKAGKAIYTPMVLPGLADAVQRGRKLQEKQPFHGTMANVAA